MATPGRPPLDPAELEPILIAVLDIVEEKSSRAISYKDVSERSGASVGKLQHHFGTRDELLRRAFEYRLLEITESMRTAVETPGTPTERLAAVANDVAYRGAWRRATAWIDLVGRSVDSDDYLDLTQQVTRAWREVFTRLIHEGREAGEFELRGTVEEVVDHMIIAADGMTIHSIASGRENSKETSTRNRRIFIRCLELELGVAI